MKPLLKLWTSDSNLLNVEKNESNASREVKKHAELLLKNKEQIDSICVIKVFDDQKYLFASSTHPSDFRHRMVEVYPVIFPDISNSKEQAPIKFWNLIISIFKPIAIDCLATEGESQRRIDVASIQAACESAINQVPNDLVAILLRKIAEAGDIDLPTLGFGHLRGQF